MPRHARFRLAGHLLHVTQRGNNRAACFHAEPDYSLFEGLLAELAAPLGCAVHAYVLMTNHVHLLLTPAGVGSVSSLMKHLGQRYAQHFNRAYSRTGSLWEGRFRSSIVDSESYLFRCQRYIELNPVRAGMVDEPGAYRWSSYHANAGLEPSLIVVPHPLYLGLGTEEAERCTNYRGMFREPLTDKDLSAIRAAARGGFALGSEAFLSMLKAQLPRSPVAGRPGKSRQQSPKQIEMVVCPRFNGQEDAAR